METPFSAEEIDAVMKKFVGTITQIPPMYSAVKVNGKRLYEYARAGEEVERPQRQAEIYAFQRVSEPEFDEAAGTQTWRFEVSCGKGTYVRTLAVDLGAALGYPAHMSDLTRLASGGFVAGQAATLSQVQQLMDEERMDKILQPIETAVQEFSRINLSDDLWQKVKNGQLLPLKELGLEAAPEDLIALFYQDKLVSLYGVHPQRSGWLKPSKVIRNE